MRSARAIWLAVGLAVLAVASALVVVIVVSPGGTPAPPQRPPLGVKQPSLGIVLPPLDNLDPVTSRPRVRRAQVVHALSASHAQEVHLYLYWNEVQPDGPADGQTAAEYESALARDPGRSPTLEAFRRLVAAIEARTEAQVMVTLVQKVPCWTSSDPKRRSFAPLRDSEGALLRDGSGDLVRPRVHLAVHQELSWNAARRRWDACDPWLAPTTASRFGDFAQTVAASLANLGVHDYEIGNEPNHDPENDVLPGESPVAKYASLLTAGARGVRRGDPHATIVAGAFSGDGAGFLSDLYARLGARGSSLFDAVSVHKYPAGPPQSCNGALSLCSIARTRKVMNDHGDAAKPIWITELGYSTCAGDARCVSERDQANYLAREERLLLGHDGGMRSDGVSRIFVYDLHDFGWSSEFGCGGWCNGYWSGIGLLHADLAHKPAFGVFRTLATDLARSPSSAHAQSTAHPR